MRVNLPRWGLKLDDIEKYPFSIWGVNLPRWGLKRLFVRGFVFRKI